MSQVCLISGSPGCGKTNWILNTFKNYSGNCGLIHGSSKDVGENLTLETAPLTLLDRLTRLQVNRLFTARSKQQFHLELTEGIVNSEVEDLNGNRKKEQKVPQKAVIGIGAGKNYTLYDVGTDNTQFVQAGYKSEKRIKGFGML